MTTYVKTLTGQLRERYGEMATEKFIEKIFEIGVIDHRLCKVLAIRRWVEERMRTQKTVTKISVMRAAGDHFGCTYEYVRKCMYYYIDVNF